MTENGTEPARHGSDVIRLTGLRVRGNHGVFEHEREQGQIFVVDVTMHLDFTVATTHDEVNYTVDYGEVGATIKQIIAGPAVNLIETLATRIAEKVLAEQPLVDHLEVTVHKPSAPMPVDFADVSVTVARGRDRQ